jgi:uncharacterized protein (TIGR02466 family)
MRASIVDGTFRKATYDIFPTLVQVYQVPFGTEEKEYLNNYKDLTVWPDDIGNGKTSSQHEMNFLHSKELTKVRTGIQDCLDEYCEDAGLDIVELGKSWLNIQEEQGVINKHRHELSIISGAYYPIVEEGSAPLVFESPILGPKMAEIHNKATYYTTNNMEFQPRSELLILFPSWLYHYSTPNTTTKRVTISFNTYHKRLDKSK